MSSSYGRKEWRQDLGRLVKRLMDTSSKKSRAPAAASKKGEDVAEKDGDNSSPAEEKVEEEEEKPERGDTALYVTASQLLRQRDFLLQDIQSLLIRGEVEGLFTIEERHELNEVRTQPFA